jgi:branched-chain amino acid transport system substrate-binding protein
MIQHRVLLAAATAICVSGAAVSAAHGCDLKIGSMGPMSGGAAQWGLAMDAAANLAAAEANAEGGLKVGDKKCHVTVVAYDSKYTADGAPAGANALAAESIHFIIGPVGAPEATGSSRSRPATDRLPGAPAMPRTR